MFLNGTFFLGFLVWFARHFLWSSEKGFYLLLIYDKHIQPLVSFANNNLNSRLQSNQRNSMISYSSYETNTDLEIDQPYQSISYL